MGVDDRNKCANVNCRQPVWYVNASPRGLGLRENVGSAQSPS